MLSNIPINGVLRNRRALFVLASVGLLALFIFHRQSAQAQSAEGQRSPAPAAANATIRGIIRDSSNHPIAGATVYLQAKDAQPATVHTDAAGAYHFSAIPRGVYTLRATMTGYADSTLRPLAVEANESKTIDLTLEFKKASAPQTSSAERPEFYDEPNFTVAGVTDTTNLGGHGSDTVVRNREALAKATAALAKEPAAKIDESEAGRHHLLAEADERQGNPLEAVREYQRAAELNPSESNLFNWGSELLLHRAPEPAIEVFTKGNRIFTHSVRLLLGLSASWYALGSYDQAAQRLCEASDLNPDDPNPYLFMGKMQAEATESDCVVERLARFARLQPRNALANYYYAVSLWKRRKSPEDAAEVDQVKASLEKAIRLDPRLGPAYLQLGILYSERKDFTGAIAAYQQAIQATQEMEETQMEEAHYRLSQAYRQAGETSKAQTELQIYTRISKEKADETEREHHELRQFVYQLRDGTPAPQSQAPQPPH